MNHIVQNINELYTHIPKQVKLIAVSKTKAVPEIQEAIKAGMYCFGESKVQELIVKQESMSDVQWHFIGHLQTNKVRYIASFVQMIQSVDSFRVLEEIDRQAAKYDRIIDCLLQIHIAREEAKFGFSEQEAIELLDNEAWRNLNHIRICGLMGIATFTDDMEAIRKEFRGLANFFRRVREDYFPDVSSFCELSMGMSDDYQIAIEEGATIVRVGSLIFGERVY